MTTLLITSIEDVHEYVEKHPETRIGRVWEHMLSRDTEQELTILDFLAQAEAIHARGASLADILEEGSGR